MRPSIDPIPTIQIPLHIPQSSQNSLTREWGTQNIPSVPPRLKIHAKLLTIKQCQELPLPIRFKPAEWYLEGVNTTTLALVDHSNLSTDDYDVFTQAQAFVGVRWRILNIQITSRAQYIKNMWYSSLTNDSLNINHICDPLLDEHFSFDTFMNNESLYERWIEKIFNVLAEQVAPIYLSCILDDIRPYNRRFYL